MLICKDGMLIMIVTNVSGAFDCLYITLTTLLLAIKTD